MEEDWETEEEVECQIYGSESQAIVAAEFKVVYRISRPAGLDLRFKIWIRGFESLLFVVEKIMYKR
jgi:hypothetical protein